VCQTSINVVHIINDLKSWIMLSITVSSRVKPLKTQFLFWCLFHDYFVDYYNSNAFFWGSQIAFYSFRVVLKEYKSIDIKPKPSHSPSAMKRCS